MKSVDIKSEKSRGIKLSPVPILPGISFMLTNQTGIDIKIVVDGKRIWLEKT